MKQGNVPRTYVKAVRRHHAEMQDRTRWISFPSPSVPHAGNPFQPIADTTCSCPSRLTDQASGLRKLRIARSASPSGRGRRGE